MCWDSFRRERVSFVNADTEAKWLHVANGHLQGNICLQTRLLFEAVERFPLLLGGKIMIV